MIEIIALVGLGVVMLANVLWNKYGIRLLERELEQKEQELKRCRMELKVVNSRRI